MNRSRAFEIHRRVSTAWPRILSSLKTLLETGKAAFR